MYEFEALVGELLRSRPELSREELMKRVEEKKQTVGAGYLTDQGALFLIAGEMGVSLRKDDAASRMTVKDLYIGASDVTVTARVLAVYPEATFNKKDGTSGRYQRLVLFDGPNTAKMTVWEEGLEDLRKLELVADTQLRVVNGYVRQGLDGKPTLNLGKRGKIEVAEEDKAAARLPRLEDVVEKFTAAISQERQFLALEGTVTTQPRYSEFVRQDGSPGSLFQFGLSNGGKEETRIVVWSPASRPELRPGQTVMITNLRSRRSTSGGFELHGDAGSMIVLKETHAVPAPEPQTAKLSGAKVDGVPLVVEVMALSKGKVEDIRLKDGSVVKKGEVSVGDDTAEMKMVGWREHAEKIAGIQPGEKLRLVSVTPKQTKVGTWELQVAASTEILKA